MDKSYKPYNVIDGKEMTISDEQGMVYAGTWQEDKMQKEQRINVGHFHGPVRGDYETAGFPTRALYDGALVTGATGYGAHALMLNIEKQIMEQDRGITVLSNIKQEVEDILKTIPEDRKDDVFYAKLEKDSEVKEFSVNFNLFDTSREPSHKRFDDEVNKKVETIIRLMKQIPGSNLEDTNMLRQVLNIIIRDEDLTGFDDFKKLLNSPVEEQMDLITRHKDVLDDELTEAEQITRAKPLLNQLKNKLSHRLTRETSEISMKELIQEEKILVVDISEIEESEVGAISASSIIRELIKEKQLLSQNHSHFVSLRRYSNIQMTDYKLSQLVNRRVTPSLGVIAHTQKITDMSKQHRMTWKRVKLPISLNSSRDKSEASHIAQKHSVGAGDIVGLDTYEAIFSPITQDGHKSDEPFNVQLFNHPKPERVELDGIAEETVN